MAANKIVPPFHRAPGNYDPIAACEECCIKDYGPSMTQQSMADEADINTIVRRFGLTGQMPENFRPPMVGDFTGINDYRTALHQVMEARNEFNRLPANLRARFDNDPGNFVEFCENPENLDELRKLGLAKPAEPPPPAAAGPAAPGGAPGPGMPPTASPGAPQTPKP